MTKQESDLETITNLLLIENDLDHILFELKRDNTSYFSVSRQSHQVFNRSMVETLKGTANISITGKSSRKREYYYQIGDEPCKFICRVNIENCEKAWRFSEPKISPDGFPDHDSKEIDFKTDRFLKGFYDLLAMIQAKCFMSNYVLSRPLTISDMEMQILEWLHESVRNVYEHFIPKHYSAPIDDLIQSSFLSLKLSIDLLFESKNVMLSREDNFLYSKINDAYNILESKHSKA